MDGWKEERREGRGHGSRNREPGFLGAGRDRTLLAGGPAPLPGGKESRDRPTTPERAGPARVRSGESRAGRARGTARGPQRGCAPTPGGVRWYLSDLRRAVGEYGHSLDHVIETRPAFVAGAPSRGRLVDDLPHLEHVVTSGTKLYRARTGGENDAETGVFGRVTAPYTGKKIAAPPPHLARGDRVGVAGQRVLFLADSRDAAVAEVRPAIGDVVSSAAFVLPVALRIVDLTPPPPPSGTVETSLIQLRRTTLAREIGHEFSLPVGSNGARHYLFTQYVARVIEGLGYDGIRYPSSQFNGGFNLVLFDPDRAGEPSEPALTRVLGIAYDLGEHDLWDERRLARHDQRMPFARPR